MSSSVAPGGPLARMTKLKGLMNETSLRNLKYTNMFTQMDADGDGLINAEELRAGLMKLGVKRNKNQVTQLLLQFNQGEATMAQPSFIDLAKHVQYEMVFDVGADGVLSPLERTLMKYDTDKSGQFSVAEVKAVVDDLQKEQKQTKGLKKVIALLVIGLVVAACALLAIVASANELSKENHTDQKTAALLTKGGDIVHTAEVESFAGLEALLSASKVQLDKLTQVSFTMTWVDTLPSSVPASLSSLAGKTADTTRKVAAYEKFDDHVVLILQECEMDIKITASEALVRRAGQTVATVGNFNPSGRRLAASPVGAPVQLYSSEAELAAAQGRRLAEAQQLLSGEELENKEGRRLGRGRFLAATGSFRLSGLVPR